jgi:hypothetical protein
VSGFAAVAALFSIFFVIGVIVGIVLVIPLANYRTRSKSVRFRFKDSDQSLNPDDPHDAEMIVERWLATRDSSISEDSG